MHLHALVLLLLGAVVVSNANTLQSTIDVKRLQSILEESLKSKDVSTLFHAVKGLKLINAKIPNICEEIKTLNYDLKNIEQMYYLTTLAALTGCQNSLKPEVLSAATAVLEKKEPTLAEIYHAVYTLKALGKGSVYDKEDALKNLIQLLKKDDSPVNYGYVFGLCEHMGCAKWTMSHAEGVLLAADETDSKALHFEGGLPATSLILTTIIRTYKSAKKASPLSEEQRVKFAEYLVSRRAVTTARGAALLLDAALVLADDEPTPVSISIKGKKYVTSEADTVEFSVSDLLGRPLKALRPEEVVAQSATRLADDVVVLSKQPLTPKPSEPTTFVLNLSKIKSQYGLYKIAVSAGRGSASVSVAVLGEITVTSAELGLGDVDGTTSPKLTTVTYPNKLPEIIHADHLQKLTLKLSVRDKWNKPVLVQQAFVRLANQHDETIFVAEPDNTKAYKVELNVGAISKHVGGASGEYGVWVYLGDCAAAAPVSWHLATVRFTFGHQQQVSEERAAVRGPLPEISHVFRSPEARPARILSDVFACACAAPLLLLLALWAKLGINFGNFPLTPSALLFHLSLGGSLALYGVLWLQLTMFETIRYLVPLAALTFLSGHRLLRRLVNDKAHR